MTSKQPQGFAREYGAPVVVVDRDRIRRSYAEFNRHLPKLLKLAGASAGKNR